MKVRLSNFKFSKIWDGPWFWECAQGLVVGGRDYSKSAQVKIEDLQRWRLSRYQKHSWHEVCSPQKPATKTDTLAKLHSFSTCILSQSKGVRLTWKERCTVQKMILGAQHTIIFKPSPHKLIRLTEEWSWMIVASWLRQISGTDGRIHWLNHHAWRLLCVHLTSA